MYEVLQLANKEALELTLVAHVQALTLPKPSSPDQKTEFNANMTRRWGDDERSACLLKSQNSTEWLS